MSVNVSKTEVVVFCPKRGAFRAVPEPTITYQGTTLPVRPEFRYLGITIKSNRWLADCALSLSVSANKALMALWHKTRAMGIRNPDTLCRLFKIIVLPVGNYACQAWAVDNLNMSSAKRILDNPLQKVVIYFLRLLSGCSPNTCSWSLLREFDFWPTQMDWVRLCARFWNCNIVGPGLQGTLLNNDVSLFLRGSTSCWAAKFLACMCTLGLIEGQSTYTLRQQNPLYFTRLKFSEEDVVRACKLLYESRWPSPVLDRRQAPHSGVKRCKYFSWCHDSNTEVQCT
jgi:hypothetical protein